jgi:cytochrome d ubiquinol oxidase subunit I
VRGLDAFPERDWPPVPIVHVAFQLMVALGTTMAVVAAWAGLTALRRRELAERPWLLRALVVVAPMGFLAIEAGWVVTEVGRQPWVVYNVLRTADAVTPMPGLVVPFALFTLLYCGLGLIVIFLIRRQILMVEGRGSGVEGRATALVSEASVGD